MPGISRSTLARPSRSFSAIGFRLSRMPLLLTSSVTAGNIFISQFRCLRFATILRIRSRGTDGIAKSTPSILPDSTIWAKSLGLRTANPEITTPCMEELSSTIATGLMSSDWRSAAISCSPAAPPPYTATGRALWIWFLYKSRTIFTDSRANDDNRKNTNPKITGTVEGTLTLVVKLTVTLTMVSALAKVASFNTP